MVFWKVSVPTFQLSAVSAVTVTFGITGMNVQYTRKFCRDGYLPAVQVGESRWYVPKMRFADYVMGWVDIEADPNE